MRTIRLVVLAFVASAFSIGTSLMAFVQARQLMRRRRSCDVSALLFGVYLVGYALWLAYASSIANVAMMVANAFGIVSVGTVLVVALMLRGSLLRPRAWSSCSV